MVAVTTRSIGLRRFAGRRALRGAPGDLRGGLPRGLLDQFDLLLDHRLGSARTHRCDIGGIDEAQLVVVAAEPHRHRRGFDEAHERGEVLARARRLAPQLRQLPLALGEIEHPDQCRTARRDGRIGEHSAQRQSAARSRRGDRIGEGRRGPLRALHCRGKMLDLVPGQPLAVTRRQLGQILG
jgi:hypothetical protein